jgi:hypothetical protein
MMKVNRLSATLHGVIFDAAIRDCLKGSLFDEYAERGVTLGVVLDGVVSGVTCVTGLTPLRRKPKLRVNITGVRTRVIEAAGIVGRVVSGQIVAVDVVLHTAK